MIQIENTKQCFESLWQHLETTRQLFEVQGKRFCIRNILRSWFPPGSQPRQDLNWDDFVWKIIQTVNSSPRKECEEILGYTELPLPSLYPHLHREMLRALTQIALNIGRQQVQLRDLDSAYKTVFPNSIPINMSKKRRCNA